MVTTWPPNFPGVGVGVNGLARRILEMSDGRLEIRVYAAGELVPA
jgi:TRAP-type mannitol/chloroaromatic compound transport system substrate-binding protein